MNIQQYLDRISYAGPLNPAYEVLAALQERHLLSIPFENLDIHAGNKITLDKGLIFEKVVHKHRGGFCYELNGLFFYLLQALGFQATRISARVFGEDGYGQEFDHLAILCRVNKQDYLLDVGFGDFTLHPLKLSLDLVQEDATGIFNIIKHDEQYLQVQKKVKGAWTPCYIFSLHERSYADFEEMCLYHQTSPLSPFTKKKLCTLATQTGRITLLNDKLKVKDGDARSEFPIESEEDFHKKLTEYFGIRL